MRLMAIVSLLTVAAGGCVGDPSSPDSPDANTVAGDVDAAGGHPDSGSSGDGDAAPGDPDAGGLPVQCVANTGGSGLNLRDMPSVNATIVAVMPLGSEVAILGGPSGDGNAWYNVDYGGTIGWAHGDYLADCPDTMPGTGMGFFFLLPWQAGISYRVSQGHNTGSHTGSGGWAWDLAMAEGTPLLAAHGGTVRMVRYDSDYGACSSSAAQDANYVVIDRGDGVETLYLHLMHIQAGSEPLTAGQVVDRGTFIGYSGATGWACGAHLHLQIQQSPSGGGTSSWYNPSVHEYFWDTDVAYDPPLGAEPVSANGTSSQPAPAPFAPSVHDHPVSLHGDASWDSVMQSVAAHPLPPRG